MNGASYTRRDFLEAASLGATGLAASVLPVFAQGKLSGPTSQARNFPREEFVRLAIATVCIDGFGDENFEPAFAMIPRLGIKHVEFNMARWWSVFTPVSITSISRTICKRVFAR